MDIVREKTEASKLSGTSVSLITLVAMAAFAANSILCRLALKNNEIDPGSFTVIRILSGAVVLGLICVWQRPEKIFSGSIMGALSLFVYASAFSYAYLGMDAGVGALVLFGAVQITMLGYGFSRGERINGLGAIGLVLAMGGLILLLLPGASAPSLSSATLMGVSGVAWGIYSILGKSAKTPVAATAGNFIYSVPLLFLLSPFVNLQHASITGVAAATASGALASGIGYAVWYLAARQLASVTAATVQLSVPIITAIGGVVALDEAFSLRLGLSSIAVLGGVAMVLFSRR